ncbi:MAG: EAL domain-containing protein [Dongiaceae bacterium]
MDSSVKWPLAGFSLRSRSEADAGASPRSGSRGRRAGARSAKGRAVASTPPDVPTGAIPPAAVRTGPAPAADPVDFAAELRSQRDRFVAFAFAAADMLIEIDAALTVRYAGGAVTSLTGAAPERLVGRSCLDLVSLPDRAFVKAALAAAAKRKRFGPVTVRLASGNCEPVLTALYGASLPQQDGGRLFLAMRVMGPVGKTADAALEGRGRLLDRDAFSAFATSFSQSRGGLMDSCKMTLLTLGGLEGLAKQLDRDAEAGLMAEIAAHLQANAIDGAAAGRLGGEKFGFLHEAALDAAMVEALIGDCARRADPTGQGISVRTTTISLANDDLSEGDKARALVYTINKFASTHQDFGIAELSEGYRLMIADTATRMREFRQTIQDGAVDVVFQPIVGIQNRKLHHYEALARLRDGESGSPVKFIQFAEETGLIGEFDLLMCRKIVEKMLKARDNRSELKVAVNLSTRSLETPGAVDELMRLLARCGALRGDLMFEITESWKIVDLEAAANVILGIRERGFPICLDDFGAGATTFQYLRALKVDYVKIDGLYVRECLTRQNGRAFLRSMSMLCRDLGVQAVGEMVETEATATFLQDAGILLGQGYLFGKPKVGALSGGA